MVSRVTSPGRRARVALWVVGASMLACGGAPMVGGDAAPPPGVSPAGASVVPSVGISCAGCIRDPDELIARSIASSERVDADGVHGASLAFDDRPATSWCEGASGDGLGEWLEVRFVRPVRVVGFTLLGGNYASRTALKDDGRASRIRVEVEGGSFELQLDDPLVPPKDPVTGESVSVGETWFEQTRDHPPGVTLSEPLGEGALATDRLRLILLEVRPGGSAHTCISEVGLLIAGSAGSR